MNERTFMCQVCCEKAGINWPQKKAKMLRATTGQRVLIAYWRAAA